MGLANSRNRAVSLRIPHLPPPLPLIRCIQRVHRYASAFMCCVHWINLVFCTFCTVSLSKSSATSNIWPVSSCFHLWLELKAVTISCRRWAFQPSSEWSPVFLSSNEVVTHCFFCFFRIMVRRGTRVVARSSHGTWGRLKTALFVTANVCKQQQKTTCHITFILLVDTTSDFYFKLLILIGSTHSRANQKLIRFFQFLSGWGASGLLLHTFTRREHWHPGQYRPTPLCL